MVATMVARTFIIVFSFRACKPNKNIMNHENHDPRCAEALLLIALVAETARPDQHDRVIVSGVGTVWPLFRTHSLLNNLQPVMGKTSLVVFYPGRYDGQSLRLFGKLKNNNYYRAFRLVP
jgi:bacteriophage exclusion system BrxB-like protein